MSIHNTSGITIIRESFAYLDKDGAPRDDVVLLGVEKGGCGGGQLHSPRLQAHP